MIWALVIVVALVIHCASNWWLYRWVWGRPLRVRYFWAAHGALLFKRRYPRWERR